MRTFFNGVKFSMFGWGDLQALPTKAPSFVLLAFLTFYLMMPAVVNASSAADSADAAACAPSVASLAKRPGNTQSGKPSDIAQSAKSDKFPLSMDQQCCACSWAYRQN